ncbi:MAG: serine/threonine protein kinase [Deltaproteobacteria bacterium]|nr:serine/threonine protein kinase [Deltaproteobacteria bacterium]
MSGVPMPSTAIVAGGRFGRYLVHECIGRGGMGEVWLASAEGPGGFRKQLVLKTVRPDLAERTDLVEMLIREAALAARLSHPNIVQVFDLDRVDGTYFIAMEYVPGYTLTQALRRAHAQGGVLPPWMVASVAAACCDGLHYAHELTDSGRPLGLVHRDISPGNIMIAATGNVTILDFGIAISTENDQDDDDGVLKGKFQYMPPETVRGGAVDRRSDVYALGVVLYVGLTGEPPYPGLSDSELLRAILAGPPPRPSARRPFVPRDLEQIALTAMAHDARLRYPTAAVLGAELRDWLRSAGFLATPEELARYMAALFASGPAPVATLARGSQTSPLPEDLDDDGGDLIMIDVDDVIVVEDDVPRWSRPPTETPVIDLPEDPAARMPTATGVLDAYGRAPTATGVIDPPAPPPGSPGSIDAAWPWAVEDQPANVPIEREQFPVRRQPRLDPRRLHPRLDLRQQRRVIRRHCCDFLCWFAGGHAARTSVNITVPCPSPRTLARR